MIFGQISGPKWPGNGNPSDEKTCRLAHFEARELSYPKMTFPGPFWNLQNQGSPIENKAKIHTQVPPRFHLSWTGFHLSWTGSQVGRVGFGSIWEEILTKWLENGPYELIFGPFGTESWSRVRFWGSWRPKMASFAGFAKICLNRPVSCVTIESGPWGHFNPPI